MAKRTVVKHLLGRSETTGLRDWSSLQINNNNNRIKIYRVSVKKFGTICGLLQRSSSTTDVYAERVARASTKNRMQQWLYM